MFRSASDSVPKMLPIADPCGGAVVRYFRFIVPIVIGENKVGNGDASLLMILQVWCCGALESVPAIRPRGLPHPTTGRYGGRTF